MGLPRVELPTAVVAVAGVDVPVRGLSRAEVAHLNTFDGDLDLAETYILARGADIDEGEAKEWRASTPAAVAGTVIDRIVELSGLGDLGKEQSAG